ncbi:hypothetical protein Tco_0626314 [Tanacetum coccineum]|uniref:Zinc knuckle CX2CX4HX4C n=1 Tax=Tanacetum coccineum TaxID=301880 RepID=A0ABQ4WJ74_9ASTR
MQSEEQEELSIKEKSKLFVQLLEARKKHSAAIRAQQMRNKPPTKAQKKKENFDKEDLETLWKLVKAKHGSTRPEEGYKRVLRGDLKTMFDPHIEDQVWMNQQDYRVLDWKIYDSCGVHSLRKQNVHIHMLVEKRYPLTLATIIDMLNKKLQCDRFSEMGRIVGIKSLHDVLEVTAAKVRVTVAKQNAIAIELGIPLMLESYTTDMCMQSWGMSSYTRATIRLQANVELKDTSIVAMPKLFGEGFYTCTIHIEYEWKPPKCACCKVFGHVQDECPKNIGSDVAKNLKNPSQAPRGVPVGPKVGFKAVKQVYRLVSVKNNVNTSVDFCSRIAPIVDKIDKLEKLIIDGKVSLVDDDGKPPKKVDYLGDHDGTDKVERVANEMTSFLASERVGFSINSFSKTMEGYL